MVSDDPVERAMQRWVVPGLLVAGNVFCLVLAFLAVLDGAWAVAVVLLAVAFVIALLATPSQ